MDLPQWQVISPALVSTLSGAEKLCLFYLHTLSSVHRLVGREELRDLLERGAFGQAALLQLDHSTYIPATPLKRICLIFL